MRRTLASLLGTAMVAGLLVNGVPAAAALVLPGARIAPADPVDMSATMLDGPPVIRLVSALDRLPRLAVPMRSRSHRPRPPVAMPPRTRMPPSRLRRPPRQKEEDRISPSEALQLAMRVAPGSMGLGVKLLPGPRPVYSVKLKAGNRIMRVLVDAVTGRIMSR